MRKRTDAILYILGLILVGILLIGIVNAFAVVEGGVETVKDNNDGNKGYILINTGTQQGGNDVGHWTDIKDVPELKGDKGDKGDIGDTGLQGLQGIDGQNGLDGFNGAKGDTGDQGNIGDKGDIGLQGLQGIQGLIGLQGIAGKDIDPVVVTNLQNTDTLLDNKINTNVIAIDKESSVNKKQNKTLQDHENRINDLDDRVNKLEKTQYVAEAEFRVYDGKYLTVSPFIRQNFTRSKLDTVGVRFTIKLGKSYEEREIEKTNARLDRTETRLARIEEKIGEPAYIEKTVIKDIWGKTKKTSWSIQPRSNGLEVNGKF